MGTISVLICAYNAEAYVGEAIESVLSQTYTDYDLVLVDDGSTDQTLAIMQSYKDTRIQLIASSHDYIRSLNLGVRHCRGELIARLDADDLMEPTRLEEQVRMMHRHLDLAACFSWAHAFGTKKGLFGSHVRGWIPTPFFWLLTGNYLIHPSAMLRKSFLREHHIQYKDYAYAEDYKLWADISRHGGQFYIIPKALVRHRLSETQVSNVHADEQWQTRLRIQQEITEELLRRIQHPYRKVFLAYYRQMLILNSLQLMQGDQVVLNMFQLLNQLRQSGNIQL
mgnify:CR=1 FL=1